LAMECRPSAGRRQVRKLYLHVAAACQTAVMDRGYGQYCPVAKGAEVFAARWIPLIIRNLDLGCRSFGEIHQARLR